MNTFITTIIITEEIGKTIIRFYTKDGNLDSTRKVAHFSKELMMHLQRNYPAAQIEDLR